MTGIIAPSRAKSTGELQRFIMDWEFRVGEHVARHNEYVPDAVKVAALRRMMTAEMAERYIDGSNTYDQVDELRSTRRKTPPSGRQEKREVVGRTRRRRHEHLCAAIAEAQGTQRDCA